MLLQKAKKYKNFSKVSKKPAFTLIEALVFLFIFTVVVSTFYSVFTVNTRYTIDVKDRQSSRMIANEKMEIIRNLEYSDIGTVGGIPAGDILASENITVDGKSYSVRTFIKYQDDPFDGVYPADAIPNDYKVVKVVASWAGVGEPVSEVELISRFVPPGLEVSSGDGVLAINVINSEGEGVGQVEVHIENDYVSPAVDMTVETDDSGNIMFPGAEESILGYEITVSKDGYETVETVDPDSVEYDPIDSHASVVSGSVNIKTIVLNKTSDINIRTVDYLGVAVPSVSFHLEGGRILGTDNSVPPVNVYNLDENYSTNLDGERDAGEKSPGQYVLSNIGAVAGYTLISTEPVSPITVSPNEEKEVKIKFGKNDEDSLAVYVQEGIDDSPIEGATVHLTNGDGYDATVTTESDGVAIFPLTAEPVFAPGEYNIEIKADGFQDNNSTVTVDNFTTKTVNLTAI